MFIKIKRTIAVLFLGWGLISALIALCSSFHIWTALSLVSAGGLVATIFLPEELDLEHTTASRIAAGAAFTLFSFIALFAETDLFDQSRQKLNSDLLSAFTNAAISVEPPLVGEESKIVQKGLVDCVLAPNFDLLEATTSSIKTVYLGPTLTLLDFTFSKPSARNSDACFSDYQELKGKRPYLFQDAEARHAKYIKSLEDKTAKAAITGKN